METMITIVMNGNENYFNNDCNDANVNKNHDEDYDNHYGNDHARLL